MVMQPARPTPLVNFYRYVDRKGPDDCWNWIGQQSIGRAFFSVNHKTYIAARWLYQTVIGPIDESKSKYVVAHTCDNKLCVNLRHLQLQTQAQNIRDGYKRGLTPKGEDHYWGKFSNEQIQELRDKHAQGTMSQRALADEFGMSEAYVSQLLNGYYRKEK